MTDLDILEAVEHGEAQDVEFKSAKGGVPLSLYETYSAMANTQGGVIVLGVEQRGEDFSIERGLENAAQRRQDIWNTLNNRSKVSVNLLTDSDVTVVSVRERFVLAMRVPKAERRQRPVFISQNPLEGTFRRNHEGDYRCSVDEVRRMLADQQEETPDAQILPQFGWDDIDMESFRQYRQRFAVRAPDHPWLGLADPDFLCRLNGWRTDRQTGTEGLTVAGLLMFGKEQSITDPHAIPEFHVDYREIQEAKTRYIDRLNPDGTWNANLFQFYHRAILRLTRDLKIPFQLQDLSRVDDTPVHEALREALTNALIHADYRGTGGIVIIRKKERVEMENPGSLLISYEQLRRGGVSECRNKSLQRMFQMLGRGERMGSGIDTILRGWRSQNWQIPALDERVKPDRVVLTLPMLSLLPEEVLEVLRQRFGPRFEACSPQEVQALVTAHVEAFVSNERLQLMMETHPAELTRLLKRLVGEGLLEAQGHGRARTYVLPSQNVSDNLGSGSHNLGSESENLGSKGGNLGTASQVFVPLLGAEEISNLRSIAYPNGFRPHLIKREMRAAVLRVCQNAFRTAVQLGRILDRNPDGLRDSFLTPMVRERLLEPLYPASRHHAHQAYRATKTPFDASDDIATDDSARKNERSG